MTTKKKQTTTTRPGKEPTKRLHPVALAIPTPLLETIREAARMMCVTQAEV